MPAVIQYVLSTVYHQTYLATYRKLLDHLITHKRIACMLFRNMCLMLLINSSMLENTPELTGALSLQYLCEPELH